MISITNLTNENNGLLYLSGKYIIAKDKTLSDVIILDSIDQYNLDSLYEAQIVAFTNKPSDEVLDNLLLKGILAFVAPKEDLLLNVKNFFDNGNISGSLNFDDLDMGENKEVRLCFVVKDMLDPLTGVLDMLTGLNIPISKMKVVRRDDMISYVLLETTKKDIKDISFKNEEGSKVLKYIKID